MEKEKTRKINRLTGLYTVEATGVEPISRRCISVLFMLQFGSCSRYAHGGSPGPVFWAGRLSRACNPHAKLVQVRNRRIPVFNIILGNASAMRQHKEHFFAAFGIILGRAKF